MTVAAAKREGGGVYKAPFSVLTRAAGELSTIVVAVPVDSIFM